MQHILGFGVGHEHTCAGSGEGAVDSGEGETVHGTEGYSAATARTRGCRAATDLPADTQRKDQADEGVYKPIPKHTNT